MGNTLCTASVRLECQGEGGDLRSKYYLTLTPFTWYNHLLLNGGPLSLDHITPRYFSNTWLGDFIPRQVMM